MHPLIQKQEQLHAEATKLLEELIYPILEDFGKMNVGGSYAYKLLNHPDIDIDVVNPELSKEMYAKLCAKLIEITSVSRFKTTDRVNFPHAHGDQRPTGYWIAPDIVFGDNVWNLDIWFQKPEWYTGNTNSYEEKLASIGDEQKIAILSLKEELINSGNYGIGRKFQSADVYDGVLDANVKTVSDLEAYKATLTPE